MFLCAYCGLYLYHYNLKTETLFLIMLFFNWCCFELRFYVNWLSFCVHLMRPHEVPWESNSWPRCYYRHTRYRFPKRAPPCNPEWIKPATLVSLFQITFTSRVTQSQWFKARLDSLVRLRWSMSAQWVLAIRQHVFAYSTSGEMGVRMLLCSRIQVI